MPINTLKLSNGKELGVVGYNYIGQINGSYEVEFKCIGELGDITLENTRFEFTYADKHIASGSLHGYISELKKAQDKEHDRELYIIKGTSSIGLLDSLYIRVNYSDSSSFGIIQSLANRVNASESFSPEAESFNLLSSQRNSNHILNSNALDFFNYQFNLLGFYIVKDNKEKDEVAVYAHPKYLGAGVTYNLLAKDQSDVHKSIKSFKKVSTKQKQSVNVKGYDIANSRDRNFAVNRALAGSISNKEDSYYASSYRLEDREELSKRKNASHHSLDNLAELHLTNLVHREGDVITLADVRYFVYKAVIKAEFEADNHWGDFDTVLSLIPINENQLWYAPEVPRPLSKAVEGFGYDSTKSLGDYSSLPLITQEPFSNESQSAGSARQIVLSSSKEGGGYSLYQKPTRMILATSDNNDQDRVALGHTSDILAHELVSNDNFEDNGILSDGGVGLSIARNRSGNDYSVVSLYSDDSDDRRSELSLGGVRTANEKDDFTREHYQADRANLEGIIQRSVSSSLDIAAKGFEHDIAEVESLQIGKKNTAKGSVDFYNDSKKSDSYLYRHYVKSFTENEADKKPINKNYISQLIITTDKAKEAIKTSIVWQNAEDSKTKVTLAGDSSTQKDSNINFEHTDTSYDFSLELEDGNKLQCKCDIDTSLKRFDVKLEPSAVAHQYQCSLSWDLNLSDANAEPKVIVEGETLSASLGKIFLDLKDSEELSIDFIIDEKTKSSIKLMPCPLNKVDVDSVDMPRGDLITQSSKGAITHESSLIEQQVYTGVLLESQANQEVRQLTTHDSYSAEKFNVINQKSLSINHDAVSMVAGRKYYTDGLDKADTSAIVGVYTKKHKGDLQYTNKDTLKADYKVKDIVDKKTSQKSLEIEHQTSNVTETVKKRADIKFVGDVEYSSNTATRTYRKLTIGGSPNISPVLAGIVMSNIISDNIVKTTK